MKFLAKLLITLLIFFLFAVSVRAAVPRLEFKLEVKQEGIGDFTQNLTVQNTTAPLIFRVYVNNPDPTTMTNARLRLILSEPSNGRVTAQAFVSTDQISQISSTALINIGENRRIVPLANTSRVYGYQDSVGTAIPDSGRGSSLLDPGISISRIDGGSSAHKHWYVFKANIQEVQTQTVVPVSTPVVQSTVVQNTAVQDTNGQLKGTSDQLPVTGGSDSLFTVLMITLGSVLLFFSRNKSTQHPRPKVHRPTAVKINP